MISIVPSPTGPSSPVNAPSQATLEDFRKAAFVDPEVVVPGRPDETQRELDALLETARLRPGSEVRGPLAEVVVDSQPRLQRLPRACVFAWRPTDPAIYYLYEPGATGEDPRFAHVVIDQGEDGTNEVWVSDWKTWEHFDRVVVKLQQD